MAPKAPGKGGAKKGPPKQRPHVPKGDRKGKGDQEGALPIYIYKVIKQVILKTGKFKPRHVLNEQFWVNDIFERIAAGRPVWPTTTKNPPITSRGVQTAVDVAAGEIAKHALL
ncbi:Histone H2B.3 [Holothuria leucospilota]|uniref:Histone H2B.3 n=1 Tax=Holothuria leucospilota TaxID=206669 RepID=A0A9Q1HIU6_HOLLE|nr:Histone H2B.3 [Holothuria leucospilota]